MPRKITSEIKKLFDEQTESRIEDLRKDCRKAMTEYLNKMGQIIADRKAKKADFKDVADVALEQTKVLSNFLMGNIVASAVHLGLTHQLHAAVGVELEPREEGAGEDKGEDKRKNPESLLDRLM